MSANVWARCADDKAHAYAPKATRFPRCRARLDRGKPAQVGDTWARCLACEEIERLDVEEARLLAENAQLRAFITAVHQVLDTDDLDVATRLGLDGWIVDTRGYVSAEEY